MEAEIGLLRPKIGSSRPIEAEIWSWRPKEVMEAEIGLSRPMEATEAEIWSWRPKEAVEAVIGLLRPMEAKIGSSRPM